MINTFFSTFINLFKYCLNRLNEITDITPLGDAISNNHTLGSIVIMLGYIYIKKKI